MFKKNNAKKKVLELDSSLETTTNNQDTPFAQAIRESEMEESKTTIESENLEQVKFAQYHNIEDVDVPRSEKPEQGNKQDDNIKDQITLMTEKLIESQITERANKIVDEKINKIINKKFNEFKVSITNDLNSLIEKIKNTY